MDALGRSSGSSEPTRSRPRVAPLIASPATSLARERRGCSSLRFFDRDLLSLPSQPPLYSTTVSQTLRQPLRNRGGTNFLESRKREVRRIPLLGKSVNKPIFGSSGCQYPASSANPSTAQDPPPWWWPESQGGATISPIWKMPSSSAACSSPSRSSTTTCSPN